MLVWVVNLKCQEFTLVEVDRVANMDLELIREHSIVSPHRCLGVYLTEGNEMLKKGL